MPSEEAREKARRRNARVRGGDGKGGGRDAHAAKLLGNRGGERWRWGWGER